MYQALYRKWRPKTFDEVVGQEHVTEILKKQVLLDRPSHAYLFTGTRGTGKTTCAKLLSKAVNCLNPVGGNPCGVCDICKGIDTGSILDVTEMDAASNNGIDDVRALRDEAVYAPVTARRRVYIIDEVHMLSKAAFNALLKIMEEPPEHLIFILATTELYKVPATILSRCQRYSFRRVPPHLIRQRLMQVAKAEDMELTEDAAELLSRLADGALRDALSLLDQCAGDKIDRERVLSAIGLAQNDAICRMLEAILHSDAETALTVLDELYRSGKDVSAVLGQLASLYRDILLGRVAPHNGGSLMSGGFTEETLGRLGALANAETLLSGLDAVQTACAQLDRASDRRLAAELCLVRLASPEMAKAERPVRPAAPAAVPAPAPKAEPKPKAAAKPEPMAAAKPAEPVPAKDKPLKLPEKPAAKVREAPAPEMPAEAPESPTPAPEAAAVSWEGVLHELEERDYPTYMLLSNPENLTGKMDGAVLRLYLKNDMMQGFLDAAMLELIGSAASSLTGAPVQVTTEPYREQKENRFEKVDQLMGQFKF